MIETVQGSPKVQDCWVGKISRLSFPLKWIQIFIMWNKEYIVGHFLLSSENIDIMTRFVEED